ncbi:short chain dehydrogenase [Hirsutella rhossiliensis]|uniref:Short chain dehydrogenase domain-containing protein n=1 Tax=Hirsutella rhossiliensis TaxID=111463 RepID=A0A9P8N3L0_9HYPO|nr:short chain dehydrogenase domain-containing protein [Hirsutella rhossiliensis]KAH0966302.1 short chain dehydrogenase domain-containing protein [Hirsutella rhossiliensis]
MDAGVVGLQDWALNSSQTTIDPLEARSRTSASQFHKSSFRGTQKERAMAPSYSAQALFEVKNLVAVVTGGGSGLGKVIAHALAANSAKAVYILGRREEALVQTRDSSPNPDVTHLIVCDVTSKDSLAAAADRVRKDVSYCNAVFANRGIAMAGVGDAIRHVGSSSAKSLQEKLWASSMGELTKTFHVNVTGAFYTAVAFLDPLDESNKRLVVS